MWCDTNILQNCSFNKIGFGITAEVFNVQRMSQSGIKMSQDELSTEL